MALEKELHGLMNGFVGVHQAYSFDTTVDIVAIFGIDNAAHTTVVFLCHVGILDASTGCCGTAFAFHVVVIGNMKQKLG